MSYDLEETSSQRIIFTPNTPIYDSKLAVSFWANVEAFRGDRQTHFLDMGASASWNPRNFSCYWAPGNNVGISWINSAGPTFSEWTNNFSITTAVWHHFYFEVDWTTNPDTALFWYDGGVKTLSNTFGTNNQTPTGTYGQLSVGGEHGSGTTGNYLDGMIAEIGIWNDNIGESRALALSKGYSPLFFRNNLTEYIPLIRELLNLKGGVGTGLNTPVPASHPRIIYP